MRVRRPSLAVPAPAGAADFFCIFLQMGSPRTRAGDRAVEGIPDTQREIFKSALLLINSKCVLRVITLRMKRPTIYQVVLFVMICAPQFFGECLDVNTTTIMGQYLLDTTFRYAI